MQPRISVIVPVYNEEELLERALYSIPLSDRYQIIVIDDGSMDDSWEVICDWYETHRSFIHKSSIIHRWPDNKGVAAAMNLGFSLSQGEYIVSLSSDDYYLTGFTEFEEYLDGKNDLVYFDLEVNDRSIWHLDEKTKEKFFGAVKFIRREFLGDIRVPNKKWHEDVPFTEALQAKHPKEVFTGIVLKHYNFPHEGSLIWQAEHNKETA